MDLCLNARAWAEINAEALTANIALLRNRVGPADVMAVVKANAYGHGMEIIAPLAAGQGITDFGVATVAEGIALRALLPQSSIFVIALTLPEDAPALVAHRLTPFVSSLALAESLAQAARAQGTTAEAHLEIDTGIGRAGVRWEAAAGLLRALDALPGLRVSGLATHFASADDDAEDAEGQHDLFQAALNAIGPRARALRIHAANSPAALALPGAHHQLIRPGLLLYGIEPKPGMFHDDDLPLRPVLSLKAQVLLCRDLPGGATISYGRTFTVPPGGGRYATVGIGYGDGYSRRLSNLGSILLHGRRALIRGRVCMDQTVVDVTDIPAVREGDTATLIGSDGDEEIKAGDLAALIGATPHEITTCLTARVPRVEAV